MDELHIKSGLTYNFGICQNFHMHAARLKQLSVYLIGVGKLRDFNYLSANFNILRSER